jgi:fatty-acyl-CoA synthase
MLDSLLDANPTIVCDGRVVTADEFRAWTLRTAGGLHARGFRRGDVLGVWLQTVPEWLVLLFACARLGVAVAALNTRYHAREVATLVAATRARAIAAHREIAAVVDIITVEDVAAMDGKAPHEGTARDTVAIFTTSGTTGSPKLPAHTQGGVVRHAINVARAFEISSGDVALCALPMAGVFGFMSVLATMAAGATCVLQPRFDAAVAASLIRTHGVTHFTAADNMIRAVLDVGDVRWRCGGFANFSGRPLELVRDAESRAGARLVALYGASEIFALVAKQPYDGDAERRATAGGVPVSPDIEVRAVDERGVPLPPGEHGELQVRGYVVMDGYLGNPAATATAMTEDGWYRTGDLGFTCRDGSFVFLARIKDSLRLRGFLVDPLEIEERLCAHEAVRAAQVVGVPGDDGEVAVAFVLLHAPADPEELRAWCADTLANFKVPARVVALDAFPTIQGPNGEKIQKTKLREMALEAR